MTAQKTPDMQDEAHGLVIHGQVARRASRVAVNARGGLGTCRQRAEAWVACATMVGVVAIDIMRSIANPGSVSGRAKKAIH